METTAHIDFIAAAYAAAVIVIGALVAWVTIDYRAQRRMLAELEMQGFGRRSAPSPAEQAIEQAKDGTKESAKESAKKSTKERA
jgi:heme exporter protein D